MVYWFIGLSGTGKTTLAQEVVKQMRASGKKVVFLDGDVIREVFRNDLGHSIEDRRKNSERLIHLCKFLESQDVMVVCAVLSIFPDHQKWNREHLKKYFQVYIDTEIETLKSRDGKGLYRKATDGEIKDVVGINIPFPEPFQSDLVIKNQGSVEQLLAHAEEIIRKTLLE